MKLKERKYASAIQLLCINIIFAQTYQCLQIQMEYIVLQYNIKLCTCLPIYT